MLTKIFYEIDNFCKVFIPNFQKKLISNKKKLSSSKLSESEIMTIIVFFHISGYRTFKDYYTKYVSKRLNKAFPNLVSYNRFVELKQSVILPLVVYLKKFRRGKITGISFVDSTKLVVCKNIRIPRHKVFKDIANRAKDSAGWYYGFKLHLVINDKGEIISFHLSSANVDDRNREVIDVLTKELNGKLFGDRGYISKSLFEQLYDNGIELFTTLRKNMEQKIMSTIDKILLRKRSIIETVNDELKNICQIVSISVELRLDNKI